MPEPIPPPRESGRATSTEVPLYWVRYGPEGVARLLVLHGGPGAHHDYLLPQMLHLAEKYDVTFYDQRGGGKSPAANRDPITWQTHVEDLENVVAELGLEPLSLVGYSWGGLLALLYGLEASEGRVAPAPARIALIDPGPLARRYRDQFEAEFTRRQQGLEIQRMREELSQSGLRERDVDAYRQRTFELGVAAYFAHPENARNLTPFRVTGRVQQQVWDSLGDYDLIPRLSQLKVPTIIIHGREDPIPAESSMEGARAMGAELVLLDDCGHVPYVEQPAALFSALDSFLARTDEGGKKQ